EHQWLVAALGHVDDHEALVHVDLGRGQADARRGVHGLEHVVEQALELRRGDASGIQVGGDVAQARMGQFEDGEQGHWEAFWWSAWTPRRSRGAAGGSGAAQRVAPVTTMDSMPRL